MKKLLLAFALVLLGPTAFAATVQGEVLEVRDAAPYTYPVSYTHLTLPTSDLV